MTSPFADVLARIEAELELPYPERALLLEELAADLDSAYADLRARGLADDAARAAAISALAPGPQSAAALAALHRPAARRALDALPAPLREGVETGAACAALALLVVTLSREATIMLFIREGGVHSWLVLGIGLLALLLLLQRAGLWFVLRNHSAEALRQNTPTPLYLAAASLLTGVMGSGICCYVVLLAWSEGQIPDEAVRVGLRESLSPVILGSGLASLAVLLHGAMQAGLRMLRITPA